MRRNLLLALLITTGCHSVKQRQEAEVPSSSDDSATIAFEAEQERIARYNQPRLRFVEVPDTKFVNGEQVVDNHKTSLRLRHVSDAELYEDEIAAASIEIDKWKEHVEQEKQKAAERKNRRGHEPSIQGFMSKAVYPEL